MIRTRIPFALLVVTSTVFVLMSFRPPSAVFTDTSQKPVEYDSVFAAEIHADQYGMGHYVLAYLKAGPNRNQSGEEATRLQRAHLDNIRRLANEGKLVLAGPFLDDGEIRGIYVFDVPTLEEARDLTNTDPAVQAGRLVMELHPWYGSAALRKLNELHLKGAKTNP